jgi:hypothetical protein
MAKPSDPFLARVPVLSGFRDVLRGAEALALPESWLVGLADIVDSTQAIASGRYKTVNIAGAAVIAAVANALDGCPFPFVFGGDGASFAIPPDDSPAAAEALAATAVMVAEEFGLTLRTALVPVRAIREAGYDLRLAFFAASPDVRYAMFSGGGLAWAEAAMKTGAFALSPAPAGSRPDLSGLSCRFDPIESRRGTILSIIVRPMPGAALQRYYAIIEDLVGLIEASPDMARPVPQTGPPLAWIPPSLGAETRLVTGTGWQRRLARLKTILRVVSSTAVMRLGLTVGRFDARIYLDQLVNNSDYRKYDDGLRMTIDCTSELAAAIEVRLAAARESGLVAYGLHRQPSALLTCFTPSVRRRDHVHFVDGGAGGYAAAAAQMKLQAG